MSKKLSSNFKNLFQKVQDFRRQNSGNLYGKKDVLIQNKKGGESFRKVKVSGVNFIDNIFKSADKKWGKPKSGEFKQRLERLSKVLRGEKVSIKESPKPIIRQIKLISLDRKSIAKGTIQNILYQKELEDQARREADALKRAGFHKESRFIIAGKRINTSQRKLYEKIKKKLQGKPCPEGKIRSSKTGRCIKVKNEGSQKKKLKKAQLSI